MKELAATMQNIMQRLYGRADASDIANAVLGGTDALMLSGETTIGKVSSQVVANHGRYPE